MVSERNWFNGNNYEIEIVATAKRLFRLAKDISDTWLLSTNQFIIMDSNVFGYLRMSLLHYLEYCALQAIVRLRVLDNA